MYQNPPPSVSPDSWRGPNRPINSGRFPNSGPELFPIPEHHRDVLGEIIKIYGQNVYICVKLDGKPEPGFVFAKYYFLSQINKEVTIKFLKQKMYSQIKPTSSREGASWVNTNLAFLSVP